jgi:UrcA family protein
MRLSLTICVAAAVLASAPPAAAGHTWLIGPNAFNVRLNDLDLRLPAGRAQALVRIEAAAARLCRKAGTYAARRSCREEVVDKVARRPGSGFVNVALTERREANVRLAQSK